MLLREKHPSSVKSTTHWFQRWRPHPVRQSGTDLGPALAPTGFSAEELRRLTALRERLRADPAAAVLDIEDPAREFARWLVTQGKLTEGLPPGDRN